MQTIPPLAKITVAPRQLNSRLWQLVAKEAAGTVTPSEQAELNQLCTQIERMETGL